MTPQEKRAKEYFDKIAAAERDFQRRNLNALLLKIVMFGALIIATLLALTGCDDDMTELKPENRIVGITNTVLIESITITKLGEFKDYGSPNNSRAVYRITDSKTGKEYVGIDGLGISGPVPQSD